MLPFKKWIEAGEFFRDNIEEANAFVYGADDQDIQQKLDKLEMSEYPVLVGIMPSVDATSMNMDKREYSEMMFYYLLVPIMDRTFNEEIIEWEKTQKGIQRVEMCVLDNYEIQPLFRQIKADSFHYDPEYGIWNKMGFSVRFQLENSYFATE